VLFLDYHELVTRPSAQPPATANIASSPTGQKFEDGVASFKKMGNKIMGTVYFVSCVSTKSCPKISPYVICEKKRKRHK
jgi:hypothetical protein